MGRNMPVWMKEVLQELIRKDHKKGFVSFIRRHYSDKNSDSFLTMKNMLHPGDIMKNYDSFRTIKKMLRSGDIMMWICSYSAERCATALLEGKTGVCVDLNVPLQNGCYPLHLVAENLRSRFTDLFLRHGARTDLCCAVKDSKYLGMLPLSIALEALRCHDYLRDWNPSKSTFKLIYCLCFPELQEPLETVKLLSEKTPELESITSSVVREGKLVELAALLFVAWNKLLVPVSGDDADSSFLGQCITKNLASLVDLEFKLINTGRNVELSECRKMQDAMASATLMLTVFERSGELIDRFRLLCFDRADFFPNYLSVRSTIIMLKQLGFALKREDTNLSDMRCFHIGMNSRDAEEEFHRSIDWILQSRKSQVSSASFGFREPREPVTNNLAANHLVQPPSSSFSARAFHTCRFPTSTSVPKLCTPAEGHHHMKTISSKRSNFLCAMRGAYYGLTLMRLRTK
ncbi:OLC1v1037684C1 [Oldenlandia corymbosa var. corymbosa]|uniref:OLC1v1037684C1 n=1 Tax=Oldenlandia corymbosa var. corymbosa TaxID=529605 RepID=A0AAV1D130_OLDCO|nr:OLC1v1037684C1 [Oldenlandia corymbosa var. corymbosa]